MTHGKSRTPALWGARITKWIAALCIAATPFMFATRLYQHGFETVPVYVNRQLAGHANNFVVTLCFCAIWLMLSYGFFRAADETVEKALAADRLAGEADKASN